MATSVTVSTPKKTTPYVGPRSIQTGENLYGRGRESAELVDLLIAERIVLLHSPSGAGKSSLVNASVIPQMEEQGFMVLPIIRLNMEPPTEAAATPGFNRYAFSMMRSLESKMQVRSQYSDHKLIGMSLAEYVQEYRERGAQRLKNFDPDGAFVLIFDQLEEFIRISATDRDIKAAFFAQLGDILRDRSLWALFVTREDYLAALEPYSRPIPTRLSVTYRLDFLDARSAIEAIQKPAIDFGVAFDDVAAAKLVDDLRRIRVQQADGTAVDELGPYVEPVQLQVVCLRLWSQVAGKKAITLDDVTAAGNIDDALSDYYNQQVKAAADTSGVSERQIREWVDRKLITMQGIRGQVLMEPDASGGLPNKAIKILQEAYLVRGDKRGNAVWFELSHDRLTRPMRRSNAEWFSANLSVFQRQADVWNTQSRTDSLLLRGEAYEDAVKWASQYEGELQPVEKEFLEACRHEHQIAVRGRRMNMMIRWAAVLMTLLAVAALFFFFQARDAAEKASQQEAIAIKNADIARTQEQFAREQEELARQKEQLANINLQIANIRELAAKAINTLPTDPELSISLALKAIQDVELEQPEMQDAIQQVEDALRQALPAMRVEHVLKDTALSTGDPVSHSGTVWSASFNNTGQRVATAGDDGSVKIWETVTGKLAQSITVSTPGAEFDYGVASVSFSQDGKWLAAATGEGRIVIYDAVTFAQLKSFQAHTGTIWALSFSPEGNLLASAGDDGILRLWDTRQFDLDLELVGHQSAIQALAFNSEGTRIASGGSNGQAIVWDTGTGRVIYRLQGHIALVNGVAFSPDGRQLATAGGDDRMIILWSMVNGQKQMTITGHHDWIYSITYTKDGTSLISVSADRSIRFWDTQYGRPGMVLNGHKDQIFGLAISPDGKRIVTTSKDFTARIWNISVEGSREFITIDNRAGVYDVAVSPDGKLLASGGSDNLVHIWNPTSGRLISTLAGHNSVVEAVNFSPDGKRIATAGRDQTVKIWDVATGAELLAYNDHKDVVWDIAFSPDGKWVASGGEDTTVKIWDSTTGQTYQNLVSAWGVARALAFSPDGSILAVGYYDSAVVLWETATGKQLATLMGHTDIVQALDFRPDGLVLASAGDDGTIILWDMNRANWGQSQPPLRGRGDTIFGVAFSTDGKYLLSGGADGIGTLWSLEDREIHFQTYGHTDRIYAVAINPDGNHLYTGGRDGSLRMYVFSFSDLISLARRRTTREFSEEECREFLNEACPTDSGLPVVGPLLDTLLRPGDVPASPDSELRDVDSSSTASELRTIRGDEYDLNLFERPFNGGEMNIYYPDIDIRRAELADDDIWAYLTISMAGLRGDTLLGNYALELDLDVDGRNDYLITTLTPGKDWSVNGVRIWNDANGDIGNGLPYVSDPPQNGDGYETLVFDQGTGDALDLAWSRLDPNDPNSIQIAFQRKVIGRDPVFAWLAWASRDTFKPAWFDYNDHFTLDQAGSPLANLGAYPLKALAGIDNTCRVPVGFAAPGQSGFCQPDNAIQSDAGPTAP